MSRTNNYRMLSEENNKQALDSMQQELSRLSDMWDTADGSPDIDRDEKFWKESEKLLNEKEVL